MARRTLCLVVSVLLAGCPSLPPDDGLDGGERCTDPDGYTTCASGGATCCHGVLTRFFDGPCWSGATDAGSRDVGAFVDAGNPCDAEPTRLGCPCDTDGEMVCGFFSWIRVCRDRTWQSRTGYVCCD